MFHPRDDRINACVAHLQRAYADTYGTRAPAYGALLRDIGRLALHHIATTTAPYHNLEHTLLVTLVGQEILRGKQRLEGRVTPRDWAQVVLALCCHDIGYVRGVCQADGAGVYTTGRGGQFVTLPPGATDAALTPYHVDRGQQFVREQCGQRALLDVEAIVAAIERTRFPVPADAAHQPTADYPGLVRAADLIGQLADPHYLQKLPALFAEFAETGTNARLGYATPADLRAAYPAFFEHVVQPYIQEGLWYLQATPAGRHWITSLYAQVRAAAQGHRRADARRLRSCWRDRGQRIVVRSC